MEGSHPGAYGTEGGLNAFYRRRRKTIPLRETFFATFSRRLLLRNRHTSYPDPILAHRVVTSPLEDDSVRPSHIRLMSTR